MTPNQVYESFIIKVNENAATDNISVDRGRFVKLFNEGSNKFVEWILEKKNEDDIRYLNPILVTKSTNESEDKKKYQLFKLEKDFFDLGVVFAKGSGDCCKGVDIEVYEIKTGNTANVLFNDLIKPSFEYREAPYFLESKNIKVFTNGFHVDSLEVTYYKYPQRIDLVDEFDPESQLKDADDVMEFDDKVLDRIISIAASDNSLNTNNPNTQLRKQNVVSKF